MTGGSVGAIREGEPVDDWTGLRKHHLVGVRVSDEHYLYLHALKNAGIPITETIRQALNIHMALQAPEKATR